MCGIAGISNFDSNINDHINIINNFQNDLSHRGPDAKGFFIADSKTTLFCHTRLSIIDTSNNANQPIMSPDKRFAIIFNGELYNYQDLRKKISKKYTLKTESDTEVLLYMYMEYGKDCLEHFSGMFSFAIWDDYKQEVFIARDPLGIKPLYYHFNNNKLIFSSELRTLIKSNQFNSTLNYNAINSYLLSGYFHEPSTIINEVYLLEAGNYIIHNKNSFINKKYYDPYSELDKLDISRKETHARIESIFTESIKNHLVSDVPLGIFLSGGIDSTAVLSKASEFEEINTISIGFQEKKWNESDTAKEISNHFKTNHHEYIISEQEALESIDDFLNSIDQPSVDGFNTYFISKFTKQLGYKVVLSGLGGDELFGGYSSFRRMKLINKYIQFKKLIPINFFVKRMFTKNNSRLIDLIHSEDLYQSYLALNGVFSKKEAQEKMIEHFSVNKSDFPTLNQLKNNSRNINSITRDFELNHYLKNQLLRDSDVFSMRWSTEIRTPFIDKNFVTEIRKLPDKYIFEKNKNALVNSLKLPTHLINKKKQGFTFPFAKWIKSDFGDMLGEYDFSDKNVHWYKIWTLFVLKSWINKNI